MGSRQSLPFPPMALVIGMLGVLLLAGGILGLTSDGEGPLAILADPTLAWFMVGIGVVLILAETVVIAMSITNRSGS